MSKLLQILLLIAAFVAAFFLFLARQKGIKLRAGGEVSRSRKYFITTLALILGMFGGCAPNTGVEKQAKTIDGKAIGGLAMDKSALKELEVLKKCWLELGKLDKFDSATKSMEEKYKEEIMAPTGKALENLVASGAVSTACKDGYIQLCESRYENIQRKRARETCYKMSYVGMINANTKDDLEKRFKILEELALKKQLKETVINEAVKFINKDLEMLLALDKYFKDGKMSSNEDAEFEKLIRKGANFEVDPDNNKLKIRDSVKEATALILSFYK